MNKQFHSHAEFPAQLEISREQPSQQRAQTEVMKEHSEMCCFEILAQLAGALTVADEERIHIDDVVGAARAGGGRRSRRYSRTATAPQRPRQSSC